MLIQASKPMQRTERFSVEQHSAQLKTERFAKSRRTLKTTKEDQQPVAQKELHRSIDQQNSERPSGPHQSEGSVE